MSEIKIYFEFIYSTYHPFRVASSVALEQFSGALGVQVLVIKLLSSAMLVHVLDYIRALYPNMLELVLAYSIPKTLPRAVGEKKYNKRKEIKEMMMENRKSLFLVL